MRKRFGAGVIAGLMVAAIFGGGIVSAGALGVYATSGGDGGGATASAIGPRIAESNYVHLTPCRLFDTRKVAAGAFENEARHFDAIGNLAGQGGKSGGCGVPRHANGVTMTITGVTPTGKGFMRGKAYNGSKVLPQATQLNYAPGIDASNTLSLPIAQGLNKEFTLGTFGNRVHLVGDVVGYHTDPFYAVVDWVETGVVEFVAENRFASVSNPADGIFDLRVDSGQDIRGCAIHVTPGSSDPDNGAGPLQVSIEDGATATTFAVLIADADGDLVDEDFMVQIQC